VSHGGLSSTGSSGMDHEKASELKILLTAGANNLIPCNDSAIKNSTNFFGMNLMSYMANIIQI
jgi:hypothetical protein